MNFVPLSLGALFILDTLDFARRRRALYTAPGDFSRGEELPLQPWPLFSSSLSPGRDPYHFEGRIAGGILEDERSQLLVTSRDDEPDLEEQARRILLAKRIGFLCACDDLEDETRSLGRPALEVLHQNAPKLADVLLGIFASVDRGDIPTEHRLQRHDQFQESHDACASRGRQRFHPGKQPFKIKALLLFQRRPLSENGRLNPMTASTYAL